MDLARDLHEIVVTRVVPRSREDAITLDPEDLGIGVHARWKRSRDADVRIDGEVRVAHLTR
jgi:hypothetical protein